MKPSLLSLISSFARKTTFQARSRRIFMVATMALTIMAVCAPTLADPKKKKNNCLIVNIINWKTVTNVALERWEPVPDPGMWVAVAKHLVKKNNKGVTEFCDLKPGAKYRIRGTSELNSSQWQEVIFQPGADTGSMTISIVLN